jgi:hypothetical protein
MINKEETKEKINVAKLLEGCPRGMELDCVMYEDCRFLNVDTEGNSYLIRITTPCGIKHLDKYGCYTTDDKAKCIIFPKGKMTWEGFVQPCKFKGGDVVYCKDESRRNQLFIIKEYRGNDRALCYLFLDTDGTLDTDECVYNIDGLATEEEKVKLFQAIKDNGYKWNAETKTLEKLIQPQFKVGDKVRHKNNHGVIFTITSIEEDSYVCGAKAAFRFDDQDDYELVPNKFNINTLKPFDKVLVRDTNKNSWHINFYESYNEIGTYPYITLGGNIYRYCIPYKGNEHLVGLVKDCDDYYKNWK